MKCKLTFIMVFFTAISIFAQEGKTSLEINFPIFFEQGDEDQVAGIDAALKIPVKQRDVFNYGCALNYTYLKGKVNLGNTSDLFSTSRSIEKGYQYLHVNTFLAVSFPEIENFHQFVEMGFTFYQYEITGVAVTIADDDKKRNGYGFNIKFGIQCDLSNHVFFQTNYHYVRTYIKNDENNDVYGLNTNLIKVGLGIRF